MLLPRVLVRVTRVYGTVHTGRYVARAAPGVRITARDDLNASTASISRGAAPRSRAPASRTARPRAVHSTSDDAPERDPGKAAMFASLKRREFQTVGMFRPTRADEAKAQIARFLSARMRTRRELFEKLTIDKGYEAEDANEALDAMEAAGAVSDAAYAEAFARHKWRTANWAAARVRRSLRDKGVSDRDIDTGFTLVFGEEGTMRVDAHVEDAEEDADEVEDLARLRAVELLRAARAQFHRNPRGDVQARIRRLMSWLERRGHSGSVIMDVVKVIRSEAASGDESDDAFRAY